MSYVDWSTAASLGRRVASAGPEVSYTEAAEVVEELRDAARRAHDPVATTAQLDTTGQPEAPVVVVDRKTWIDVNVASFRSMTDPVFETLMQRKNPSRVVRAVGGKVTAVEAGGLLGYVSSRVLGQFDIAPNGTPSLLLVAPNIVEAERELGVDPHDFRLWVALHEETHRVQFTAVPWLREHVVRSAQSLVIDLVPEPEDLPAKLKQIAAALPDAVRGGSNGLADVFATPQQRETMADLTAVMSLLEGHADVVMDDVGPEVVPSVATIRERFDTRRKGAGALDRLMRRLIGLEAKMAQYRDGAAFCRAVIDRVGVEGLNAVWSSPAQLPSAREIAQPQLWLDRVHG